MGDVLSTADLDAVRYLLKVSSRSLSDDVMLAEPNLPFIEAIVEDLADSWDETTGFDEIKAAGGSDWTYLRVGTMHLLAARLLPHVSMGKAQSVRIGDYSRTGSNPFNVDVAKELIKGAAGAFSRISTRTFTRPTILVATGPTSSQAGVPEEWEEWFEMILPRIVDYAEEGEEEDDAYYSTSR